MDPIIFSKGGFELRWYSVLLLVAFFVAYFFVQKESKRFNIKSDFIFNMLFWVLIFGVIGARLYYVIFDWASFKSNPMEIFKIWNGGLAIHGGLIAGLITMIIYTKKYKFRTIRYLDFCVVGLILAQAIGRWGNFFNSEAHGAATTYYHLKELHIPEFVIDGMKIGNNYYHPTFFYESIYCLIGFIILLFVRRYRYLKRGQLTCLYMMYYSVGRFFIESLRTDSLMLGGFRVAQLVSIVLFIVGLMAFMILSRKGRFEDLYNEEQNGPIRF